MPLETPERQQRGVCQELEEVPSTKAWTVICTQHHPCAVQAPWLGKTPQAVVSRIRQNRTILPSGGKGARCFSVRRQNSGLQWSSLHDLLWNSRPGQYEKYLGLLSAFRKTLLYGIAICHRVPELTFAHARSCFAELLVAGSAVYFIATLKTYILYN